jgi:hypothetical protein
MRAEMEKMAAMGGEGLEIAQGFKALTDKVSDEVLDVVDGLLGLGMTIRDDLNPITKNVIDVTNLPALLCSTAVRVIKALRPTKEQGAATANVIINWREATTGPNRLLFDALEASLRVSINRWIGTLEKEGEDAADWPTSIPPDDDPSTDPTP